MLKYSKTPGIFKLEGNRLGRPYHRLPTLFTGNFDVIDSHLGSYFLKKHRKQYHPKKDWLRKLWILLIKTLN